MGLLNIADQKKINSLVELSEMNQHNLILSVQYLEDAWGILPEPKTTFDDSFHLAKFICKGYMDLDDFAKAKKWADILLICDLERIDSGEREFWSGKVLLELKENELAFSFFKISNEKSKGRCFINQDKKYFNFYKNYQG